MAGLSLNLVYFSYNFIKEIYQQSPLLGEMELRRQLIHEIKNGQILTHIYMTLLIPLQMFGPDCCQSCNCWRIPGSEVWKG